MKKDLIRILSSAVLFAAALIIGDKIFILQTSLFVAAYIVVGFDVLWRAVRNILRGQVFDENFLMSLATVGAFIIGEYPEAVAVMLFYQTGEMFQDYAVGRSRRSISELMDIRPDYANLLLESGDERVDPERVNVGDMILVKPGEKIPLDGVVVEGSSFIDTSALTGESVPRAAEPGGELLSGCINLSGVLTVRVTKPFGESTVSKILDLVENSAGKKSRSEYFITRFAAVYTPVVVISAALLAVIPPLIIQGAEFSDWIYRALNFLVVSCPCALVISVPLSFFGGIGGASKAGILVKGSVYLESLAKVDTVVFDKTGTLTEGVFDVQSIIPSGVSEDTLLEYAAYAESYSSHPISMSLRRAYGGEIDNSRIDSASEIAGQGVRAVIDGKTILAGNSRLMEENGIAFSPVGDTGTVVYLSADGAFLGGIVISDKIKADAAAAIAALKSSGVRKTVMLTGDVESAALSVADKLGIDKVYAELLPDGKVHCVEELLDELPPKSKLMFVGDGINDAPVLARSDIGVAMGALGSDAAIEAADIVIMTDEPSKLPAAVKISRKTMSIVTQNIVFALGVKAAVLILSALGYSTMWHAVFADVGVSFLAVLNALRALRTHSLTR